MFVLNTADAPGGTRGSFPYQRQDRAIKLARRRFERFTGPGEITVSDALHNVVFRIYRREENETPVELLA